MAENTKIEWCDSVLNLQMGCDGCELWTGNVRTCYAGVLTERYGGVNAGFPESFDKPKLYPERLAKALRWKDLTGTERPDKPWLNSLPRLIFLDDMGDTFTESLPLDWLAEHLPAMADSPHQFLCLTKRPSRMRQFSERHELPANFWPGTSITKQQDRRLSELVNVRGGGPKFVSAEPLLGAIKLPLLACSACGNDRSKYQDGPDDTEECAHGVWGRPMIDWVIVGGESGPGARPCNVEWIRDIRDQCAAAGVPCFVKQFGSNPVFGDDHDPNVKPSIGGGWRAIRDPKGGDSEEWPEDLRVRQFPEQPHD